jgi:IS30 family transposase
MDYKTQRHDLLMKKMKLDKFFTMYLDKFDKQMDPENSNTPVWKLFKQKSTEYNKISQEIRNIEYWINKNV